MNEVSTFRGHWMGKGGLVITIEAKFLDEILLRVFLLAIQSNLYSFAFRFLFLQNHAISYSFYSALQHQCAL